MSKFWNFIKNAATEGTTESVELRIEGNIVSSDDSWFYEWFGIPVASPNNFRNELSQYKGQDITVWIDSYGGDVFAGAGIYNALMEHKNTGAKVTCKIDGKAMSAASVIAMAADEILISPVGIMMIHNPLSYASGYASDMRKTADVLDTVKETILNAYCAKVNKSREEISAMMDNETYMDANKSVKEGYADGILYQNNSDSPKVMNFTFNRNAILNCANESIKKLIAYQNKQLGANPKNAGCQCAECSQTEEDCKCSECGNCPSCCNNQSCCGCSCKMDNKCDKTQMSNCKNLRIEEGKIVDLKELKNKYPDIYKAAYEEGIAEGIKNEQERLKAIDEISNNLDPELVNKAKYIEPMNAEKLAFEAIKNDAQKGAQFLNTRKEEIENSGVAAVVTENNDLVGEKEQEQAVVNGLANFMNKKRGGTK